MVEHEGFLKTNSNEEIYEDISKYLTSFDINTTFGTDYNLSLILQGLENLLQKVQDQKLQSIDFDSVLTSIVFLLKESKENQDELIRKFCNIIVDNQNTAKCYSSLFKSLLCLFRLMDDKRPIKCSIYCSLLKMIKSQSYLSYIDTDMKVLKNWFNLWRLTYDEIRPVIKQLYETLTLCDKEDQGLAILNESLKLCQKEKMELGKEDARRSLILHIKNPKIFLFDHFINIPLVMALESEPIYQLFQIFLKMKFTNYMKFYEENKDFIEEIGLIHDDNIYKMRILTFMQIAGDVKELPFKKIVQELSLNSADVEDFIINVVRSKMVRCKIDELGEKVIIDFAMNRVFDKERWLRLNAKLGEWIDSLTAANKNIKDLKELEGCDYTLEDLLARTSLNKYATQTLNDAVENGGEDYKGLGSNINEQSQAAQNQPLGPDQDRYGKEMMDNLIPGVAGTLGPLDMLPPHPAAAHGSHYPPRPYDGPQGAGPGGYYYPPAYPPYGLYPPHPYDVQARGPVAYEDHRGERGSMYPPPPPHYYETQASNYYGRPYREEYHSQGPQPPHQAPPPQNMSYSRQHYASSTQRSGPPQQYTSDYFGSNNDGAGNRPLPPDNEFGRPYYYPTPQAGGGAPPAAAPQSYPPSYYK